LAGKVGFFEVPDVPMHEPTSAIIDAGAGGPPCHGAGRGADDVGLFAPTMRPRPIYASTEADLA
jgi:hypothetical protein